MEKVLGEEVCGWKRIEWYDNRLELWKTPTKFLVCMKYQKIFKFCETLEISNQIINDFHN